MIILLPNISASEQLAQRIAPHVRAHDVVALDGELGSGKTSFVRALVTALGGDARDVSSPTYTLLHQYDAEIPVIHIDAYRLRDESELEGLGFSELREGAVSCIEWAQRIGPVGADNQRWSILFAHTGDGGRSAHITFPDERTVGTLHED